MLAFLWLFYCLFFPPSPVWRILLPRFVAVPEAMGRRRATRRLQLCGLYSCKLLAAKLVAATMRFYAHDDARETMYTCPCMESI